MVYDTMPIMHSHTTGPEKLHCEDVIRDVDDDDDDDDDDDCHDQFTTAHS